MVVGIKEVVTPELDQMRMSPPSCAVEFSRYIEYIRVMVGDEPTLPHSFPILLSSLSISPIPIFNKTK